MSEFIIKPDDALIAADDIIYCAVWLNDCVSEISSVMNSIGNSLGYSSADIVSQLSDLCSELYDQDVNLTNLGLALQKIVEEYKKTEFYVAASAEGKHQVDFGTYASQNSSYVLPWTIPSLITAQFAPGVSLGIAGFSVLQLFRKWWTDDSVLHGSLEENGWSTKDDSYNVKTDLLKFKNKEGKYVVPGMQRINDYNDKKNKWKDKGGDYIYDFKTNSWKKALTDDEKKDFDNLAKDKKVLDGVDITIASVGIEKKGYVGGLNIGKEIGDKDGTHASGEIGLLYGEAEANAYIGYLSAGVSAGASFSAVHAEGDTQWGSDMAGLYVKGEVDALKAEVGVDAYAGLKDKEGNFAPALHLKGEAEALLAEGSIKGGAKVLGTDVGVKMGVNVGIGAHADVGFRDWKLTLDLGASFGVGVSLKLDVDLSGTVDAICDFAESALDDVCGFADSVGDTISDVWSGLGSLTGWW